MEVLVVLILLCFTAWWFFNTGKRSGSRKGYHVGRSRARRRR